MARYALGIAAALCAGTAFNIGVLIQKTVVDRTPAERPLMRSLVRHPRWLVGVLVSFFGGTPLYITAVGLIGPALVPGLMSIGLVVLTIGAILVKHERLHGREAAGIGFIILAVSAYGFSRLQIDVFAFSTTNVKLLERSALFVIIVGAGAVACTAAARRIAGGRRIRPNFEPSAALRAAGAGLWYNVTNLSLGFVTAGLALIADGGFGPAQIIVFALALVFAAGSNLLGVSGTQHALASGRATVAIPLQEGVTQIVPVAVFFFVYRPYIPSTNSFVFLGTAFGLLLTGVILLTNRLQVESALRKNR